MAERESNSKFSSDFDHSSVNRVLALNTIRLGQTLIKYADHSPPHFRRFYLHETDHFRLVWISPDKSFAKTQIKLVTIWKISLGQKSHKLRKRSKPEFEPLTCSIYYGYKKSSIDLLFPCAKLMHLWLAGLQYMIEEANKEPGSAVTRMKSLLRDAWADADADGSGALSLAEVKNMLKKHNIDISDAKLRGLFDEFDTDKSGSIEYNEFELLMNRLMHRPELEAIFTSFSRTESLDGNKQEVQIPIENLRKFIRQEQDATPPIGLDKCQQIVENFGPISRALTLRGSFIGLNVLGFTEYLFNTTENSIMKAESLSLHQDMTRPLTHYWINSSHNTYLTGHQLNGHSSVFQYVKVLNSGCRCVELDCWDGPSNEPIITHGHTLVSNIKFRDVVQAISDNAFKFSPYPVILSLEMHCSVPQQDVMADIFLEIFGDKIYVPPSDAVSIPSPDQLKNKFLLKGKKPAPGQTEVTSKVIESEAHKKKIKVKISTRLSDLYCFNYSTFDSPPQSTCMVSFSENKIEKLAMTRGADRVVEFTQQCCTRIYPAGLRLNSSNYNPVFSWSLGNHCVALNWQSGDLGMALNQGLFSVNGGNASGYVLKDQLLMNPGFNPFKPREPVVEMSVCVISGRMIPKPMQRSTGEIVDPYVVVEVHGAKQDQARFQTAVVSDNGFNPAWNETFNFKLRLPELAHISFQVFDKDLLKSTLLCHFACPVNSIRKGMRAVPLYDSNLELLMHACLLVKISSTNRLS